MSNFDYFVSLVLCFNSLWSKFNICAVAGRVQKGTEIRYVMLKARVNARLVFGVGMMGREHTHVLYMF